MLEISKIRTALQFWWRQKYSEIQLWEGEEIAGGWLSRAFRFEYTTHWRTGTLFLRTCKSLEWGYTYSADRLSTFAVSHEMYERANSAVRSYGVFGILENGSLATDLLEWNLSYFHVQDFLSGYSLLPEVSAYKNLEELDVSARNRMADVGELLANLHNIPVPQNIDSSNAIRRSQREVFTNPQTTLDVLACYPLDHPILGITTGKYQYIQNMLRIIDREAGFSDQISCVPLHGDFWSSNILIDSNEKPFLIDYSRIPYGDPAIDVGTFLGSLIFDGLTHDAPVYFSAAREFIDSYKKHRNISDARLLDRSLLVLFWMGIIRMYPPVFGNTPPEKLGVFEKYIQECYTTGRILLDPVPCR